MNKRPSIQRLIIGTPIALLVVGLSVCASQSGIAAAQIASPTPTGSQIQIPTNTPTQVGGPTATPSRTPSATPVMARVIEEGRLRTEPDIGTEANIIVVLEGGVTLPVIGRWIGYDWLLVAYAEAPGGQAWIHLSVVELIGGDLTTIPAVTPLPQATVEPTQAALNATATVILQTPGAAETATAAFTSPSGVYTVTPGNPMIAGVMPTFTPPEPYVQPETLVAPVGSTQSRRGPAPAVLIIALSAMGMLTLVVGLLRRL